MLNNNFIVIAQPWNCKEPPCSVHVKKRLAIKKKKDR